MNTTITRNTLAIAIAALGFLAAARMAHATAPAPQPPRCTQTIVNGDAVLVCHPR